MSPLEPDRMPHETPHLAAVDDAEALLRENATLYQWSLMSALLSGVYDGEMKLDDLRRHGDFGLGTFNALDGELVAFDGQYYHLRSDGSARIASHHDRTPFAQVTFFRPESSHRIAEPLDKTAIQTSVGRWTRANQFTAMRIDGRFRRVSTRTVARQTKPYPPLKEVIQSQSIRTFSDISGTLVGFRSPAFTQGISVAGFHMHFLSDDRRCGGHVFDYELVDGDIEIAPLHRMHLEVPMNDEFERADMSPNSELDEQIKNSEG